MTRIIAIRPEPGLSSTLNAGREIGLEITGVPLSEIRPVTWECPDPNTFDAVLVGSANAILHGGCALTALTDKPVHAVGQTTANAARDAGFTVATIGAGGLQNVIDALDGPVRLLRVSGAEHVPLSLPENVSMQTVIGYESVALPVPDHMAGEFGEEAIVLLHSAAAAVHFASECERLALDKSRISLAALGPRISDAAGVGWGAIHIPEHPRDRDLLEIVRKVCVYRM